MCLVDWKPIFYKKLNIILSTITQYYNYTIKMIRVGRTIYDKDKRKDPSFNEFEKVIVLLKSSSKYWPLSPYYLKDEQGRIHENIHQFSKFYTDVPLSVQKVSRWDRTIIWSYPAETHLNFVTKEPNQLYLDWRHKGQNAPQAIRYPVTFDHRHKCVCAFTDDDIKNGDYTKPLDYVSSRKEIYVKEYERLVKEEPTFKELVAKLKAGKNLLIIEVDGPHQESLDYYKQKYNVDDNFIQDHTMLANKHNLNIMLNDTTHPYGHGYCLANALLDAL